MTIYIVSLNQQRYNTKTPVASFTSMYDAEEFAGKYISTDWTSVEIEEVELYENCMVNRDELPIEMEDLML